MPCRGADVENMAAIFFYYFFGGFRDNKHVYVRAHGKLDMCSL